MNESRLIRLDLICQQMITSKAENDSMEQQYEAAADKVIRKWYSVP